MKENVGLCKLCDHEKVLCKSHIIPKAVFRDAMADDKEHGLNKITDQRVEIGKMAGEYEYLLCKDCEELLSRYDEYGIKFLRRTVGQRLAELYGETIPDDIVLLSGVDFEKLRLFVISVLWRASISSREFYSNVRLGPHEATAKSIIKKELELGVDLFPFFISRYTGHPAAEKIIINPALSEIVDRRFYVLNMKGFSITVKVDRRPLQKQFTVVWESLIRMGIVLVYERDFANSREYEVIKRLVQVAGTRRG